MRKQDRSNGDMATATRVSGGEGGRGGKSQGRMFSWCLRYYVFFTCSTLHEFCGVVYL